MCGGRGEDNKRRELYGESAPRPWDKRAEVRQGLGPEFPLHPSKIEDILWITQSAAQGWWGIMKIPFILPPLTGEEDEAWRKRTGPRSDLPGWFHLPSLRRVEEQGEFICPTGETRRPHKAAAAVRRAWLARKSREPAIM